MAEIKQIKIEAVGLRNIKKELDDIKKSMKDVTDPSEMAKLTAEANVLEKQLSDVNKGIKEMDESTSSVTNSSKTLKQELRDLENEMLKLYHTGQNNTEEFMNMQQTAADMRSSISNMNREISLLGANDAPQQVAAGWKNVGTSLKNLDFATAAKDAERLNILTKTMSFDVVTNSLKNLGKTFASLGKALLTNPYFLLAAVVAGIIYVVKELLEELEVLDDVMAVLGKTLEWTMKPLTLLIKGLEQLVYWIGLIDPEAKAAAKAAQEAANETAKAYADSAKEISKANESITQDLDYQIKLAQLNGESTIELEREKLRVIKETLTAQMEAEEAALEAKRVSLAKKKKLTDEEKADLEKLEEAYRKASLAVKEAENNQTLFEVKTRNERKAARQKEQEEIEKANATKVAKAKAWREKQEAIRKEEAANRLAAKRLEEDLELQLMEEGDAKLLKQNQLYYERLIEDTKSNEKLNAEEKARVIAQYEKLAEEKTEEIRNATKKKEEAAAIQAQEELSALLYDLKTSDEQKVLDELDQYYEESLEKLREHLENDLITKEEFAEAEILLAQEKADRIEEIERKSEEAIRAEKQATLETNLDIAAAYAGAVNDLAAGIFEMSNNLGEQDEKAKEERAKKQFKVQKALNLVMAGIDGARAITTSLAAAPLAIGPVPNPAGIASLVAVAANTAATIAAIASKQYTGSGGGGGSPVKPNTSISSGSSTPTRQAPIVNFQGTGSNRNEVSAGGGSSNITIENTVSVSETEITDKQKTVHNLTTQSQL